jgi:plastocyanin
MVGGWRVRAAVAAMALVGLGAGCGGSSHGDPVAAEARVQHVTVDVNDAMRFVPNQFNVVPGTVQISLVNVGSVPHNMDFPTLHQTSATVYGHHRVTMTVTVRQPGTYAFVCDFHVAEGMVGSMVVTAAHS